MVMDATDGRHAMGITAEDAAATSPRTGTLRTGQWERITPISAQRLRILRLRILRTALNGTGTLRLRITTHGRETPTPNNTLGNPARTTGRTRNAHRPRYTPLRARWMRTLLLRTYLTLTRRTGPYTNNSAQTLTCTRAIRPPNTQPALKLPTLATTLHNAQQAGNYGQTASRYDDHEPHTVAHGRAYSTQGSLTYLLIQPYSPYRPDYTPLLRFLALDTIRT